MEIDDDFFNDLKETKEAVEIYKNCLTPSEKDMKRIGYTALKYIVISYNLYIAFILRLRKIRSNIIETKEKLNDYKNNEINVIKEKEKFEEIINNLSIYEKEVSDGYNYFEEYLFKVAKGDKNLKNETSKNVYISTSEEIIKTQIKNYIKYEKCFVLYKDYINNIKNIFNI